MDRVSETKSVLLKIVNVDVDGDKYAGTFVLDHKLPHPQFPLTPEELVSKCAAKILRKLTGVERFDS